MFGFIWKKKPTGGSLYPEILIFTTWFKKENEENKLELVHIPLYHSDGSTSWGLHIRLSGVIELEKLIISGERDRNDYLSDMEKLCCVINQAEKSVAEGRTEQPPMFLKNYDDGFTKADIDIFREVFYSDSTKVEDVEVIQGMKRRFIHGVGMHKEILRHCKRH